MSKKMRKTEKTKEKEYLNENLEQFQNSQSKMRKSRFFSLTTYATEKQIQKVMSNHISSVRAFCYILHDRDEAEPHYHILLRTHSTWSVSQLLRWFCDLRDDKKERVNTFCEIGNDMESLKRYILHDTEDAREKGKHLYSVDDIKDFGFNDLSERKDSFDSSYEILLRVLSGANPRDLVRYYGRDYLYHYNCYHEIADQIRNIEGYKEARLNSSVALNNQCVPRYDQFENPVAVMEELYNEC
ncbi:MAG: hypothetical protein E7637_01830 [Ruminococcaceae bacterium]|nr:hypothetical protein [Oscillospiraceae bacterium]